MVRAHTGFIRPFLVLLVLVLLLSAACGGGASPPSPLATPDTPSPEPTSAPKPTHTPIPTATPEPPPMPEGPISLSDYTDKLANNEISPIPNAAEAADQTIRLIFASQVAELIPNYANLSPNLKAQRETELLTDLTTQTVIHGSTGIDGVYRYQISVRAQEPDGEMVLYTPRLDAEGRVLGTLDEIHESALQRLGLQLSDLVFSPNALPITDGQGNVTGWIADFVIQGDSGRPAGILSRQTPTGSESVINFIPANYTPEQASVFPPEVPDGQGEILMGMESSQIGRAYGYDQAPDLVWDGNSWGVEEPESEVELEEGFVNYTFTDSELGERISVVLPDYVASVVNLAETEPGQTLMGAPLAYARIEGDPGSRVFRVGNIDIATEGPNGFTANPELTNESGYLGFETGIGYSESLGGVDPETVQGSVFVHQGPSFYEPGIGTIMTTLYDRLTPMGATRTQILIVTEDGKLVETATMSIVMGYRDANGNLITLDMDAHHMIYQDDEKALLDTWTPPFGVEQQMSSVFWISSSDQDINGRRSALTNGDLIGTAGNTAFELRLIGCPDIEASGGVGNSGRIGLPRGVLVGVDNNN